MSIEQKLGRTYQKMITSKQIEIYMESRKNELTQVTAAAKADISERTGRRIEHNEHQLGKNKQRHWRTRKDPFGEDWKGFIEPLLLSGAYEATFILEELQKEYPGKYSVTILRTLQRRIKRWRALFGKDKEVMFRQKHEPGVLSIVDFTHPKEIQISINGEPFEHIFYHFRLPFSGYNYMQVFVGSGESFEKLAQGTQEALHDLGGVTHGIRTDSLAAAYKNLNADEKDDITERYKAFVQHYNMKPYRINPGEGHENGAVESSHRHIKNRIEQSLIVRNSNDFASIEEYRKFIRECTNQHNKQFTSRIKTELASLQSLPTAKAVDYTEITVVVSCTSTIDVRRVTYSVPSRLIGEKLLVRLYSDRLECYLGSTHAITIDRAQKPSGSQRLHKIDYRHIIDSLVKKPGAFRGAHLRDAILPNDNYRRIWKHVSNAMSIKNANKFIVGVLYLAAKHNCENDLAIEIIGLIENNLPLNLGLLKNKFEQNNYQQVQINVSQHHIGSYNELIPNLHGVQQ
jgi:hypothetical protein